MKGSQTGRWKKKIAKRVRDAAKEARQFARRPLKGDLVLPRLLFIIGCQRSGTTMMTRVFEKDFDVQVYPEHSRLSNQDTLNGLRLNPLPEVRATLCRSRFPLVVLKPLVETQNTPRLLDYFEGSRALWMYRHYADVVNSNLNRFGEHNGIKNLRYIAQRDPTNWRSEKVPPHLQALVDRHFAEEMNPADAAALFWYIRNSYFFELGLEDDPRVLMLRYSDLTEYPAERLAGIYAHVGRPFPGRRVVSDIHDQSVGKGSDLDFSPAVEALCQEMLARLDQAFAAQDNLEPATIP